jgi:hypothetical protein
LGYLIDGVEEGLLYLKGRSVSSIVFNIIGRGMDGWLRVLLEELKLAIVIGV